MPRLKLLIRHKQIKVGFESNLMKPRKLGNEGWQGYKIQIANWRLALGFGMNGGCPHQKFEEGIRRRAKFLSKLSKNYFCITIYFAIFSKNH